MRLKERNFPYPMLDYFNIDSPAFTAALEVEEDAEEDNFLFRVEYSLENQKTLQNLIDVGEATYAMHLECTSTMYREIFTTLNKVETVEIPITLLNKIVNINYFIIANKDIDDYKNLEVDPDSEGFAFSINKGELLALAPPENIVIEKEPIIEVESIFELIPTPKNGKKPIDIDLSGSKIRIYLPKDNFDEIAHLRGNSSLIDSILISMYYAPAITEALRDIKVRIDTETIEEIHDSAWYTSITQQLVNNNIHLNQIDENDLLSVAHLLLDDPNKKAISKLKELLEYEEAED